MPADANAHVFDEARLLEKLRAIEALFAGAATEGERVAAAAPPYSEGTSAN
jgi:hypothetical protein